MRKYYDMIFPKWMEFAIVLLGIGAVMVVGYYWKHSEKPDVPVQPIGQYYGREMTEKIDQDNNQGLIPMLDREGEIIVSENGSTHTVLTNG
jgi:hypothetical protein